MNSVANGKVYLKSPFKRMYLPAAAGDAGGAIGSAFAVTATLTSAAPRFHMNHAYVGPEAPPEEVAALLESHHTQIESAGCEVTKFTDEQSLSHATAKAISEGKLISWFQ